MHCQNSGNRYSSFLSARELKWALLEQLRREPHKVERGMHRALERLALHSHILRTERDVAEHRLLKELILRVLEHKPHPAAHLFDPFRVLPDVDPAEQHLPLGRFQKAV